MTATRPVLGDIRVGDPVYVRRSHNAGRSPLVPRYRPATVTGVARVWVTLAAADGSSLTWRMRIDTQAEDSKYSGNNARFLTPEQHAWEVRQDDADRFLHAQGITLSGGSPWRDRQGDLADLIRAGRTHRPECFAGQDAGPVGTTGECIGCDD